MDEQRQDDQLEPIYNSSVLILDVALGKKGKREKITEYILQEAMESSRVDMK